MSQSFFYCVKPYFGHRMSKKLNYFSDALNVVKHFVFLFIVFLSAYLLELLSFGHDPTRLVNLVENIAFSSLLYSIILLFGKQKLFKYIFYGLMIFTVFEGVYFLIFNAEFTPSAIFIALDTNTSEVGEFIKFNINATQLLYTAGVLASFILSWRYLKPPKNKVSNLGRVYLVLVVFFGIFLITRPRIYNYNAPYAVVHSFFKYNSERNLLEDLNAIPNPFSNLSTYPTGKNTHVVIIGESTSRLHFGLYGYYRNTTPKLGELKDELNIFNDVVSGDTYTIGSLVNAFVVKDSDKAIGNAIQLMKQAGYKTYWLSNQPPIGIFETLVTKITMSADVSHFINSENYYLPTPYDEELLPKFINALDDKEEKKIIFIHLMGAHADYAYRYPKSFSKFPTDLKDKKQNTINHYDNALLYTDYVVSLIIDVIKDRKKPSTLLYFSDHGEEVYDSIDFAGHPANGTFSFNMIEIPFLFWTSENDKLSNDYLARKFSLNDLSHSMADLYGIRSAEIDTTRSVFHKSFVERQRVVWDTIKVK